MVDNPALVEARLRSLARVIAGVELEEIDTSADAGYGEGRGFHVVEDDDFRAVGRALTWARGRKLDRVTILAPVGDVAADLARRAELVSRQGPIEGVTVEVMTYDGTTVHPAVARPCPAPPVLSPDHWALAGVLTEAGASVVDDHGVLIGEVVGLEVARVVDSDEGPVIDVGVGQADRELNQMVHGKLDTDSALRRVIVAVAQLRGSHPHHPLTRLARERWLRAILVADPNIVDAAELSPLVPLRPRHGLLKAAPAACAGRLLSGQPVVVVTAVGVDVDLVPEAVDYRQCWNPEAELVLAMPERDVALNAAMIASVTGIRVQAMNGPWELASG